MSSSNSSPKRSSAVTVRNGAEATANVVRSATNLVSRNEKSVADVTQAASDALGIGLKAVGGGLERSGAHIGSALHQSAGTAGRAVGNLIAGSSDAGATRKALASVANLLTRTTVHAVGLASQAVGQTGKLVSATGRLTERSAPAIGGTLGGVIKGAADMTSDAVDAVALPSASIDEMRRQLKQHGGYLVSRSANVLSAIETTHRDQRKGRLLDLLVVGGVSLTEIVQSPSAVPEQVENAYRLAYPDMALRETFSSAVERMSPEQLIGFTSAVKGKLFELQLVDHLNNGGLPDGFQAELAGSAVQPGWDIRIVDEAGQVSDVLQAKATESVHYVQEALEKYPAIDVSTTTEVYAQLTALGIAEGVRNSGISEAALQATVESAAGGDVLSAADSLLPTSIGLAVIAMSVFMQKDMSLRARGAEFGNRAARSGTSVMAGKAAMVATQTWWLGLLAGVASGWLTGRGQHKRQQYEALKEAASIVKQVRSRRLLAGSKAYRMKVLDLSK